MTVLNGLRDAVINGDNVTATELTGQALQDGTDPAKIVDEALISAMAEVGERFSRHDFFVPEMMAAARAMKECLAILRPYLPNSSVKPVGKVVLATVQGDLHDIGKNLVAAMMEGAGLEIVDLGVDVSADKVVTAVQQHHPDLVGLSALLTTTMPMMTKVIDSLEQAGLRKQVKVIIGGAPVTNAYADSIGADLYAPDAASAAKVALAALRK